MQKKVYHVLSIDIQSAIARIPNVELSRQAGVTLCEKLGLRHSVETNHLQCILEKYRATVGPTPDAWLAPLVAAMMLTKGVGRYVAKLLPFRKKE